MCCPDIPSGRIHFNNLNQNDLFQLFSEGINETPWAGCSMGVNQQCSIGGDGSLFLAAGRGNSEQTQSAVNKSSSPEQVGLAMLASLTSSRNLPSL